MVDVLWMAGLVVTALIGVALAAFQLPGVWLVLAAAVGYDWHYGWNQIGVRWLIGLGFMAAAAEVFDFFAGLIAAKKAGASRRAAVGSLIGGFLGMIFISVTLPIPGFGAVAGGLIGCFLGALIAELSLNKDLETGARVGLFATAGKVVGLVAKTSTAAVICGAVISLAVWTRIYGAASL